jgi:hypothetical protein
MSGHSGAGWRQFTLRVQGVERKLANVLQIGAGWGRHAIKDIIAYSMA